MNKDTIYASLTKNQKTAISIIRVSGSQTKTILKKFLKKKVKSKETNLRNIYDSNGEFIDQGLILFFSKPHSPTGEDVAEFHVHGSISIIKKIELELDKIKYVREAEPGEFTKRSLQNDKIDLLQVEGLDDLLEASTETQRKQAQLAFMGSVSSRLFDWRDELIEISSYLETSIDFSDEELPANTISNFKKKLNKIKENLLVAIEKAEFSKKIKEGVKVVVSGPPNAGKSSLINCLLDENISIVSAYPGTTRDIVCSTVDMNGVCVNIYDTAGLHKTNNEIEIEGIKRAMDLLKISDIQIRVVDGNDHNWKEKLSEIPVVNRFTIDLINKSDLKKRETIESSNEINISTKTGENLDTFTKTLKEKIDSVVNKGDDPIIFRDRHIKITKKILECLNGIQVKDIQTSPELVAEDIRHALTLIGKITGSVGVEEVLDNLFKNFCIGK
jgi:tRNA modification GTPase